MKLRALIVFLGLLLAPLAAHAQNVTVHVVGTCGLESIPLTAPAWLRMDSTGVLCTSGSGGGGSLSAKATAAAPTYVEGTSNPLSMDLSGYARVLDKNSTALLAAVQAAIPSGTNIIGKVGIDQTTPGTTNGVQVNAALPAGTNVIGTVNQASQYPVGAVPITISATGTTTATTATLAASASIKTYICGFSIRANATAAATNNSTITGTVTGTLNFTQWTAPLASGIGLTEQIFSPCIPSSAINTGIAVISGAPGSGGVVSVSAWGYQL